MHAGRSDAEMADDVAADTALTADRAAAYASAIGSSDGGRTFGFTRLCAHEQGLGGEIVVSAMATLTSLTHVDLSSNRLISLAGLEALPALSTLLASHNRLETALDFAAPASGSRLRVADLSACEINAFSHHAASHPLLEEMLLDGNALASLEGIGVFRALHTLSCASNQLHDATPTDASNGYACCACAATIWMMPASHGCQPAWRSWIWPRIASRSCAPCCTRCAMAANGCVS